jgi:Fe-S-cluster-containing hydrogenase component 2
VEACPRDLFTIMPVTQKLIVQCKNLLEGDQAEAVCKVACTGCGLCSQDAAPGLIEIKNGLAVIDYNKNDLADPKVIERCPTGAIAWVECRQFAGMPEPIRTQVA